MLQSNAAIQIKATHVCRKAYRATNCTTNVEMMNNIWNLEGQFGFQGVQL